MNPGIHLVPAGLEHPDLGAGGVRVAGVPFLGPVALTAASRLAGVARWRRKSSVMRASLWCTYCCCWQGEPGRKWEIGRAGAAGGRGSRSVLLQDAPQRCRCHNDVVTTTDRLSLRAAGGGQSVHADVGFVASVMVTSPGLLWYWDPLARRESSVWASWLGSRSQRGRWRRAEEFWLW